MANTKPARVQTMPRIITDAALLQQIYDDEETDKIVYSIREELMERVMTECNRSYLKNQTIKFVVQCAYDAMVKFLCMNFYYHCKPPDTGDDIWIPDDFIDPSPKDTWAHSAVPIRSRDFKNYLSDEEEDDRSTIDKKDTVVDNFGHCMCSYVCDCVLSQSRLFRSLPTSYDKPCSSRVKFSPKSSRLRIEEKSEIKDDQIAKVLISTRHSSEISDTNRSITDTSRSQSVATTATSGDEIKRKKEKPPTKEIKLVVPLAVERGSQASVVRLPPIRVNTKLTSKPETTKKKRKK